MNLSPVEIDRHYSHSRMIAMAYRLGQSLLRDALKESNVLAGQADFLWVVSRMEGITQAELADLTMVTRPAIAQAVKDLESKGYLRRETDDSDRRVRRLYLTDEGRRIAPDLDRAFDRLIALHHDALTDEENEQLKSLLEKTTAALAHARNAQEDSK